MASYLKNNLIFLNPQVSNKECLKLLTGQSLAKKQLIFIIKVLILPRISTITNSDVVMLVGKPQEIV